MAHQAKRRVRGDRSDGARALDRYLRARDISVPVFCEKYNINRLAVQRALSGDAKRISLDLALDIDAATGGKVKAAMWRQSTVRKERPGESAPDC